MSWAATVRLVVARAGERCEYCRMHQSLQGGASHVEHIVPSSQGGSDEPDNLALSCPGYNLHKSDRTEATDPQSGATVRLFNPRTDRWADHFLWDEQRLVGLTDVGRTTIPALDLNHSRRLRIRQAEALFGLFPPPD